MKKVQVLHLKTFLEKKQNWCDAAFIKGIFK